MNRAREILEQAEAQRNGVDEAVRLAAALSSALDALGWRDEMYSVNRILHALWRANGRD